MKKLIIILTNVFLLTISTSSCAMSGNKENNKQEITKENFSFKNYKNEEDAQKDLLKLFPVGSDIESLVKFLEKSGFKGSKARYYKIAKDDLKKNSLKPSDISNSDHFTMLMGKTIMFREWMVSIPMDNNKISRITVSSRNTLIP